MSVLLLSFVELQYDLYKFLEYILEIIDVFLKKYWLLLEVRIHSLVIKICFDNLAILKNIFTNFLITIRKYVYFYHQIFLIKVYDNLCHLVYKYRVLFDIYKQRYKIKFHYKCY